MQDVHHKSAHGKEKEKELKRKKPKEKVLVSFEVDDEEAEEKEESLPKKKIFKNPEVDTSFLPDRERDFQEAAERKRLEKEFQALRHRALVCNPVRKIRSCSRRKCSP